jgi:hypothetical protein
MKTQLIAALMISGALIASPAFAGNTASNNPFTTFPGVSTKTRAEVNAELTASVQDKSVAPAGNRVDPSDAVVARQTPSARTTGLAQGNGLMDRERP